MVLLRLALVALLLTAACGVSLPGPPSAPAAGSVAGRWTGRVQRPDAPLDVTLTLTGGPGGLAGTFDVPEQGITGLPLAGAAVDGATVRFAVPGLPGDASFLGALAADASALGGVFSLDGRRYPLVLQRRVPS